MTFAKQDIQGEKKCRVEVNYTVYMKYMFKIRRLIKKYMFRGRVGCYILFKNYKDTNYTFLWNNLGYSQHVVRVLGMTHLY